MIVEFCETILNLDYATCSRANPRCRSLLQEYYLYTLHFPYLIHKLRSWRYFSRSGINTRDPLIKKAERAAWKSSEIVWSWREALRTQIHRNAFDIPALYIYFNIYILSRGSSYSSEIKKIREYKTPSGKARIRQATDVLVGWQRR